MRVLEKKSLWEKRGWLGWRNKGPLTSTSGNKFNYLGREWVFLTKLVLRHRGGNIGSKESERLKHSQIRRPHCLETCDWKHPRSWRKHKGVVLQGQINSVSRISCSMNPVQLNALQKTLGRNRKIKSISHFEVIPKPSLPQDYVGQDTLSLNLFWVRFCVFSSRECGLIREPTTAFPDVSLFGSFWFLEWNIKIFWREWSVKYGFPSSSL